MFHINTNSPKLPHFLQPQHRKLIEDSGIIESVYRERGYYSEAAKPRLKAMNFSPTQQNVPALVIPVWDITGHVSLHQIRPDQPRSLRGKVVKYETPHGARLKIDIHPSVRERILTSTEPFFITEGVRKADAAISRGLPCVALLGVDGWTKDEKFWQTVPLKERVVYIVFDSDIATNINVAGAARRLFEKFVSLGARPHIITLAANGESKVGLDDYFVAGGTAEGLYYLAKAEPPVVDSRYIDALVPKYAVAHDMLVRVVESEKGTVNVPLANFHARIVSETVFGPSTAADREFEIEATVKGKMIRITLHSEDFEKMNWPIPKLGPEAIIFAGSGRRDEVRAAIQIISRDVRSFVGIRRTGWHWVNDQSFYVHSGGVIFSPKARRADLAEQNWPLPNIKQQSGLSYLEEEGTISPAIEEALGIRLDIHDQKNRHRLPSPSTGEQLVHDFGESLKLLSLAPGHIAFALYSAIWFSAVAVADFSIHLCGISGVFKSELAALIAQHFGAGNNARSFLGWSSTTNFIRAAAAGQGNSILVVDDFVPTGSQYEIDKSNRAIEDVFRGQGNGAGRGRCNRDGTIREPDSPSCLILSTGEVRPSGHSLAARVIILEVNPGDIANPNDKASLDRLTDCQKAAKQGAFSRLTAGFIAWVATNYEEHRKDFNSSYDELRNNFSGGANHARTTDAVAKLAAGLRNFLQFGIEKCQLSEEEADLIWERSNDAFHELLNRQDQEQSDESPVKRFISLIQTALATGRAHLQFIEPPNAADIDYGCPIYFGYKEIWVRQRRLNAEAEDSTNGIPNSFAEDPPQNEDSLEKRHFIPQGQRIGWKHQSDIYLEPNEALAMAQQIAKAMGQPPIPLNVKALGKRLAAENLLASSKSGRNLARKNIDGRKLDVFHLSVFVVLDLVRWERDLPDEEDERMCNEHEHEVQRKAHFAESMENRRRKVQAWKEEQFKKLLHPDEPN